MKLLERHHYYLFYGLLLIIYVRGLFIPLMDNDSAHHAVIAMRMTLEGDYLHLFDRFKEYLDKPHFLFWSAAGAFELFGIRDWAYRLPSLLFTLLGIYSTVRLGSLLYNRQTGQLAGLILAASQAFILANHDVRMDAILTGSTIFGIWQLTVYLRYQRLLPLFLGALGLAAGMATKGMVAPGVAGIALFCLIAFRGQWGRLFNWKLPLLAAAFFLFLAPVLYAYYVQFDAHPEKGVSGVRFILWEQNFERMQGGRFQANSRNDYFFFFHTILWAFLPWSLLFYGALFSRLKQLFSHRARRVEMLSLGGTLIPLLLFSLSSFKLPHYLNILFPFFSILLAGHLDEIGRRRRLRVQGLYLGFQYLTVIILVLLAGAINFWAFPARDWWIFLGAALAGGLLLVYCFLATTPLSKALLISLSAAVFVNFLLNFNFYPQLLEYQSGKYLAETVRKEGIPLQKVYFLPSGDANHAFDFYTGRVTPEIAPEALKAGEDRWICTDRQGYERIRELGLPLGRVIERKDFRVTRLNGKFLNPATREQSLETHYLVEIP